MATTTRKASTRKSTAARHASGQPRAKDGSFKSKGSHWGTAAIVGGVAAVGAAATAALFALRGTSWNDFEEMLIDKEGAHQADGTDGSASFDAKIADEGTIPA